MSLNDERIKGELVAGGIKLWEPPYFGVAGKEKAFRELASTLSTSLQIEQAEVLTAIENLQKHALHKLRSKGKLLEDVEIKTPTGFSDDVALEAAVTDCRESCLAEKVTKSSNKSLMLHRVNPTLTVATLYSQLRELFNVGSIKLVCQGKSLRSDDGARLGYCIKHPKGTATLLCLIATTADLTSPKKNSDEALVQSICDAASDLQNKAGFEVTDAHGNLVSMKVTERIAFLKALGLHAVGKQRMDSGKFESSLIFMLQADHEWNSLAGSWRSKVDNFGRLQLDICWVYLKLESLDNLEDTTERLELAENVLRKQVHKNFLTLALVQAEQDMPVPAVSFIFVRLFLLQAITFHYKGNSSKAKERIDWAWALAKSLRSVSPPDVVTQLCEITNVTRDQAISALRRTNGDVNRAVELAVSDRVNAQQSKDRRKKQVLLGLCENGQDFVDLQGMSQLKTVLGLGDKLASGLLRLSNNQLDQAIDIYQEANRDHFVVLRQVAELDQKQGLPTPIARKRSRIHESEVDEVGVATLVSMGITSEKARQALLHSGNNVDVALVWLANRSSDVTQNSSGSYTAVPMPSPVSPNGTDFENEISEEHGTSGVAELAGDDQAVDLLKHVLGEVLHNQNQGNEENLGESLDDEWSYIVKYKKDIR